MAITALVRTRRLGAAALVAGTAALAACGTPPPPEDPDALVRCLTDKKTIEIAVEAYAVSQVGVNYPSSLQDVLDEGYLKPSTDISVWTYVSTSTGFTLTGPC